MGEKLVLYGRDVFGQSITDASPNIKASQNLVIINSRQETLAIGLAKVPSQHIFKEGSVTVINVLDIGYYLRFQGKGLS
jgi:60S ribosome subunit biogenesis protein NIP7